MRVQVNTDKNVEGRGKLVRQVEAQISAALARFSNQITRIEVHLGDENAGKSGGADKRCMLEARPAGREPVSVSHHAATVDEALTGATQKLKNLLESSFGRLDDRRKRLRPGR
ncbi:MAG: HPF/RaiA family ribosome-associated protein [Actinomycetota bacterium]|jgi:hypothetical protein|nr:HPF/RaiA family ribosome-associated protein [Actinomycetota bacterium]